MSHTGEYRRYLLCTSGLAAVAMICYSQWTPTSSYYFLIPTLMIDGFASGSILTSALVAMLSCVKQHGTVLSLDFISMYKLYENYRMRST